ncbi:MAG: DNA polymerase III subunit beta [Oscillospiraceae bacterium]|nr:DNA polymerase III subunit beta [Oscillospiraceae bacterium]
MKFICNTSILADACQSVQRAVSTKTSIPAIEGIFIKALGSELVLTGYDLEMGITTSVPAKVEENGGIVINAKVLCEILRKLPDDSVCIESDERQVAVIRSGEMEYSLIGIAPDEYPELPSVSGVFPIVLQQDILKEMIRQTIFSVAVNENKVVHTGIKFEITQNEIKLIAVDGFRLAVRKEVIDYTGEDATFIVPAKSLSEVVKLFSGEENDTVSMCVGKRHIVYEIGQYTVVSRLLDGEFLNYRSAIPNLVSTTVKVNTRKLIESIERTSLIITDKIKSPLRCSFDDNLIRISSTTALGTANDKIPAEITGAGVEIGFNNRFLLEALRVCDTDEVYLQLNGSVAPIVIVPPEGDRFLFLILPVRLKAD